MLNILTINKPNITDYASARNELLNNSKSEWNLYLDNDEKLNNELTIKNYEHDSYYLTRKNYFLGQYVGTDKIIRLVKKGTGKWKRAVHEIWVPDDKSKVGTINDQYIIHNTADNLTEYINKMNKYSTLHAAENLKEGKKSSLIKIVIYPIGNFVVYLYKSKSIVFSIMKSLHSYLSWSKLYFLQH